jgi:GNAT superfamily N-acetyltransferase
LVRPLSSQHDRANFTCGVEALDRYLQRQARQDSDRRLAAIFVLTPDDKTVAGFYTLSAFTLLASDLPVDAGAKLPRFPLPATLLGRMAVSQTMQGQGLGDMLLGDALNRAFLASRQVASWAVVVDAKIGARNFYLKREFLPLPSQPDRLFLPMAKIEKLITS